jgi:hypothetical protein
MEVRIRERMDVITEHIRLAKEHKGKVKLSITDGVYTNFGRSHYYIDFEFLNNDDTICYDVIPNKNRITWYIWHEDIRTIDSMEILDRINNDIRKDYEWVTSMVNYFLYHDRNFTFKWRPTVISTDETRIKEVVV